MTRIKKTVLAMLVLTTMGQTMTSCTKSSDDQSLYENAGGGDDGEVEDKPGNQ